MNHEVRRFPEGNETGIDRGTRRKETIMSNAVASQGFICKLKDRKEVAEGTMAFQFEKPSAWTFKAGQYLDMTLLDPKR